MSGGRFFGFGVLLVLGGLVVSSMDVGCTPVVPMVPDDDSGDVAPMDDDMSGDDGSMARVVSFSGDIQPLFDQICAICHSVGGFADIQGIDVKLTSDRSFGTTVNQPSVQDPTLTVVVPGDLEGSLLFQKISTDNPPVGSRMPLGGRLNQGQIDLIRDWIEQGALNN